jgi:hypothetical protein
LTQLEKKANYNCWDNNAISEVLKLLKVHSLKDAAAILNTSPQSISKALMRRGISARGILHLTQRKTAGARKIKTYIAPSVAIASHAAVRAIAYASAHRCKFPIGELESEEFRYCNAPCTKRAYCAAHAALMYQEAA